MPQSIVKMPAHIVFSTKNRAELISPEIENSLFRYIHGITENKGAKLIIANGTTDHVHLLISMPKKIDIPELTGDIKRDSSVRIKQQDSGFRNLCWQRGYGAFSVEVVRNYIARQKDHHRKRDFKTEYRGFLKKYEIEFDEKFVWD